MVKESTEKCLRKSESRLVNVGNFDDNGLNVNNWNHDNRNDNLWVSPLIVSSIIFGILSIHRAFCQFPVSCFEDLNIFCFRVTVCLLQVLAKFLVNPVLHLFFSELGFYFLTVKWKKGVRKCRELSYLIFGLGYIALFLEK